MAVVTGKFFCNYLLDGVKSSDDQFFFWGRTVVLNDTDVASHTSTDVPVST